jgi:hypothetical protein
MSNVPGATADGFAAIDRAHAAGSPDPKLESNRAAFDATLSVACEETVAEGESRPVEDEERDELPDTTALDAPPCPAAPSNLMSAIAALAAEPGATATAAPELVPSSRIVPSPQPGAGEPPAIASSAEEAARAPAPAAGEADGPHVRPTIDALPLSFTSEEPAISASAVGASTSPVPTSAEGADLSPAPSTGASSLRVAGAEEPHEMTGALADVPRGSPAGEGIEHVGAQRASPTARVPAPPTGEPATSRVRADRSAHVHAVDPKSGNPASIDVVATEDTTIADGATLGRAAPVAPAAATAEAPPSNTEEQAPAAAILTTEASAKGSATRDAVVADRRLMRGNREATAVPHSPASLVRTSSPAEAVEAPAAEVASVQVHDDRARPVIGAHEELASTPHEPARAPLRRTSQTSPPDESEATSRRLPATTAAGPDAFGAEIAVTPMPVIEPFAVVPPAPVGISPHTVKDMAVVTVPAAVEASSRTADTSGTAGVRAAEAVGHRRALSGEARGQILLPELGRVEVRAFAEASKIDVHVRADERDTRHVIQAHAPELSAHVHREIPEARVFVERSADFAGELASRDPGRNQAENGRHDRDEREPAHIRSAAGGSDGEPMLRRSRARVRIVL